MSWSRERWARENWWQPCKGLDLPLVLNSVRSMWYMWLPASLFVFVWVEQVAVVQLYSCVLLDSDWRCIISLLFFLPACRPSREVQGVPDTVPEGAVVPPPLDSAWAESTRKKALLKLEKLDTDLKNYKGNSIKESIRSERKKIASKKIIWLFFFFFTF